MLAVALVCARATHPQDLAGWRFWDISDGMAESYTSGVVETTEGTLIVSWPHPVTRTTNIATNQYVIPNLYLRI